jgi:hypothetical protein
LSVSQPEKAIIGAPSRIVSVKSAGALIGSRHAALSPRRQAAQGIRSRYAD